MAQYKSFEATTDKGTPCCVINESENQYKVILGSFTRYYSSGIHVTRDIVYAGKKGWISKEKIRKGRAKV